MSKTRSKAFRVATEGATTDGRAISREWITQMAANYSPAKYGARIFMEHIRGMLPDGPFKAYGDVRALTAKPVEDGKLALFAELDPTPELVAMTKSRQKVFTSIEVNPKFADTGEAYLVGLSVTDSPASLGTEMLAFSVQAGADNPLAKQLAARKLSPDNLFSAATEAELEWETYSDEPGLFDKVKQLINGKSGSDAARFADIQKAVELVAEQLPALEQQFKALPQTVAALKTELDTLKADFSALRHKLETTPATPPTPRPPALGGSGTVATDC